LGGWIYHYGDKGGYRGLQGLVFWRLNFDAPDKFMIPELIKEIITTPGLIKELYGDLAKPGVQQVGSAIGGILGLGNTILYPLHLANGYTDSALKKNLEIFRSKLENIPIENITSVSAEIGVPILEKLTYVVDATISDMFIELLAKASNNETVSFAHPNFIKILEAISPDEANFVSSIFAEHREIETVIPAIEIRLNNDNPNTGWSAVIEGYISHNYKKNLRYPDNLNEYLSNLISLGVLKLQMNRRLEPVADNYPSIWSDYMSVDNFYHAYQDRLQYGEGVITITDFGKSFLRACKAT
jgi:hypothetical protein